MKFHNRRRQGGFTLTEVVIAVGVFAFVLVSNYALFGLSVDQIRDVGDRDAAVRAASALREGLRTQPLANVVSYAKNSGQAFIYNYRASLTETRSDADKTPVPHPGAGTAGRDYKVVPAVRFANNAYINEEERAREGTLLVAKMSLSSANPLQTLPADGATYAPAALALRVEFYETGSVTAPLPANARPVYTCTVTYMR